MGKCLSKEEEDKGSKPLPSSQRKLDRGDQLTVIERGDAAAPKNQRKGSQLSNYSTGSRHVVEKPVKVGAFNVRRFGKAKLQDDQVVALLVKIVRRYDIILIQEIVDVSGKAIEELTERVNTGLRDQSSYKLIVSPRLGRTKSKEQYAFLYKSSRFKLKSSKVYEDPGDIFIREPFVVQFKTNSVQDLNDIVLIGVHTQPSNAVQEIDSLVDVGLWARKSFHSKNLLFLGDFNAGGDYVKNSDWPKIRLRSDKKKYHWLIKDHVDTTATNTLAAYDRIVAYDKMVECIVPRSGQAFRFDEELHQENVGEELLLKVSDHYPVEVDLKASVHPVVRENIHVGKISRIIDKRYHGMDLQSLEADFARMDDLDLSLHYDKATMQVSYAEVVGIFYSKEALMNGIREFRQQMPELLSYSLYSVMTSEVELGSNSNPPPPLYVVRFCSYVKERTAIILLEC